MSEDKPLWREHLGLLVTGVVFTMFLVRLQIVTHGDQTTALAILERTGPATVLFGLAATVGLPLALLIVVSVGTILLLEQGGDITRGNVLAFAAALLGVAYLASWLSALLFALWLAWLLATVPDRHDRQDRPSPRGATHKTARVLVGLVVATDLFTILADDGMWLPRERFTLTNGTTFVGYALDHDETTMTVLRDGDRTLVRLAVPEIAKAEFCGKKRPPWWTRPIAQWRRAPRYPRCTP